MDRIRQATVLPLVLFSAVVFVLLLRTQNEDARETAQEKSPSLADEVKNAFDSPLPSLIPAEADSSNDVVAQQEPKLMFASEFAHPEVSRDGSGDSGGLQLHPLSGDALNHTVVSERGLVARERLREVNPYGNRTETTFLGHKNVPRSLALEEPEAGVLRLPNTGINSQLVSNANVSPSLMPSPEQSVLSSGAAPVAIQQPNFASAASPSDAPTLDSRTLDARTLDSRTLDAPVLANTNVNRHGSQSDRAPHSIKQSPIRRLADEVQGDEMADARSVAVPRILPNDIPAPILENARKHLEYGASLARRGATYTARKEFIQVLYMISQAADAIGNTNVLSDKLMKGLAAIEEADDFGNVGLVNDNGVDVTRIVAVHRSQVIGREGATMSPIDALQRYFAYARENISVACVHQPLASEALYSLGKLYSIEQQTQAISDKLEGPKAIAFHEMAILVDPENYRSSNELGVLLARYGQLQQAKKALLQSVSVRPNVQVWKNLASVHRNLGERELEQLALKEAALTHQKMLANQSVEGETGDDGLTWVGPKSFDQMGVKPSPDGQRQPANEKESLTEKIEWWEFWRAL